MIICYNSFLLMLININGKLKCYCKLFFIVQKLIFNIIVNYSNYSKTKMSQLVIERQKNNNYVELILKEEEIPLVLKANEISKDQSKFSIRYRQLLRKLDQMNYQTTLYVGDLDDIEINVLINQLTKANYHTEIKNYMFWGKYIIITNLGKNSWWKFF